MCPLVVGAVKTDNDYQPEKGRRRTGGKPKKRAWSKSTERVAVMAFTIISIKEKKGEFQGAKYHNYTIFAEDKETKNEQIVCGSEVDLYKVKAERFIEVAARNIGVLNNPNVKVVRDFYGLEIVPTYDKYGNVTDFVLSVPSTTKK